MLEKFKLIFLLYFIILCTSQKLEEPNCSSQETCGACIRELGCVWCNTDDTLSSLENINFRRCISEKESLKKPHMCKYLINPDKNYTILANAPLTAGQTTKNAVQISPQKVYLTLRKGQEHKLEFKYAQAEDYPVDLYYIMDLSSSMDTHKKKLSLLGTKLAAAMKNLTKNFRLGFGSFVDKVTLPFTNTVPSKLIDPCSRKEMNCAPPYSFQNHLSLTENTDAFAKQVNSARISGNIDHPEGTLDALMQAIVCKEEIGWREKARRLLVISSDAQYHIAGDGKLGGVVIPHDGKCYMENHTYTQSLHFDYPSIGHINAKAIEHNINIIFAVTQDMRWNYSILKERIKNSAIGTLSSNSSNVIDLITGIYDKLVDSVKVTDNSDNNIEIKYYSACTGNQTEETNQCDNLRVGVEVNFTAVVKLLECPKNGTRKQTFQIKPGALNESLVVEVELLCDCDCEKPGNRDYVPNAIECSNEGDLKCGVCDCHGDKLGTNCECDGKNITLVKETNNCREDESSEICSGLGTCKCNKCVCQRRNDEKDRIYGKYCQCNNYSCKRNMHQVCSGETRGVCDCGKCVCLAGFAGDACECPDSNNTCIAPDGKEICSGKGECVCGVCQCTLTEHTGTYCDECPTCSGKRCAEFQHCVECITFQTGKYNASECLQQCTQYNIEIIKEIVEAELEPEEKYCVIPDASDCYFFYKYSYDKTNTPIIFAQKTKVCSAPINILAVVLSVIGSILLGGIIILLIWKGVTTLHDRREYAKFENERKNAKWQAGDNPLFKNPTTTFRNPMFTDE